MRYALSTQTCWSSAIGCFDLEEFFWIVVNIIEEDEDFKKNILSWWNQYVAADACNSETYVFIGEPLRDRQAIKLTTQKNIRTSTH